MVSHLTIKKIQGSYLQLLTTSLPLMVTGNFDSETSEKTSIVLTNIREKFWRHSKDIIKFLAFATYERS